VCNDLSSADEGREAALVNEGCHVNAMTSMESVMQNGTAWSKKSDKDAKLLFEHDHVMYHLTMNNYFGTRNFRRFHLNQAFIHSIFISIAQFFFGTVCIWILSVNPFAWKQAIVSE
jgi:hypothetical protein